MDGKGLKETTRVSRRHHVEHARCERFYRPGKGYGRRAAKAFRRTARL